MARNLSPSQFRDLMETVPKHVAKELRSAIQEAGASITSAMRVGVPKGVDGRNELLASIRFGPGRHPLQIKIEAGGPTTQREVRQGASVTYDYANAIEFGTEKMIARPFFFSSYRLVKKKVRARMQKRAKNAIEQVVGKLK